MNSLLPHCFANFFESNDTVVAVSVEALVFIVIGCRERLWVRLPLPTGQFF